MIYHISGMCLFYFYYEIKIFSNLKVNDDWIRPLAHQCKQELTERTPKAARPHSQGQDVFFFLKEGKLMDRKIFSVSPQKPFNRIFVLESQSTSVTRKRKKNILKCKL